MTPDEMRSHCHQLIEKLYRSPGAAKLLARAATELEGLAAYKAHRRQQRAERSPPVDSWRIGN